MKWNINSQKTSYGIISFIICLLIGIMFIANSISSIQKGSDSENWPSTTGYIISSNIVRHPSKHGYTYGANITYQYSINDHTYSSNRISYGDYSSSDGEHANQLVTQYYVGRNVTVFYNPKNPSEAILEPGATFFSYMFLLAGILPIVIGIIILYFFVIRSKIKKNWDNNR